MLFIEFFKFAREKGLRVYLGEWLDLLDAVKQGLCSESLSGFYHISRALWVKRESDLDNFDQIFAEFFRDIKRPPELTKEMLSWLDKPILPRDLTTSEKNMLKTMDLEKLREEFEKRLQEQKEKHDGGNRWIGTGGTSPFGHGGVHPGGLRIGGQSRGLQAAQVYEQRRFKDLRKDRILDTRSLSVALKKLRVFDQITSEREIDIHNTIKETARNCGDLQLVMQKQRRSSVKLIILFDVGGSMTPYTHLTELLFSTAAKAQHFKDFQTYFFHNCPYEFVYESMELQQAIPTQRLFEKTDTSYFLFVVGDAAMNPYELMVPGGSIDYFHHNEIPGIEWLKTIRRSFPASAWLNPRPQYAWQAHSCQLIQQVFPAMFPLTVDGISGAIERVMRSKINHI